LYFPVNAPWARGDHTIWLIPSRSHTSRISGSILRYRIEYSGWLDTNRSTPGMARAASICSAVHSLNPR